MADYLELRAQAAACRAEVWKTIEELDERRKLLDNIGSVSRHAVFHELAASIRAGTDNARNGRLAASGLHKFSELTQGNAQFIDEIKEELRLHGQTPEVWLLETLRLLGDLVTGSAFRWGESRLNLEMAGTRARQSQEAFNDGPLPNYPRIPSPATKSALLSDSEVSNLVAAMRVEGILLDDRGLGSPQEHFTACDMLGRAIAKTIVGPKWWRALDHLTSELIEKVAYGTASVEEYELTIKDVHCQLGLDFRTHMPRHPYVAVFRQLHNEGRSEVILTGTELIPELIKYGVSETALQEIICLIDDLEAQENPETTAMAGTRLEGWWIKLRSIAARERQQSQTANEDMSCRSRVGQPETVEINGEGNCQNGAGENPSSNSKMSTNEANMVFGTNSSHKIPRKLIPENPDVTSLAYELQNRKSGETKICVALRFTKGNRSKAESLLSQILRFEAKHREG